MTWESITDDAELDQPTQDALTGLMLSAAEMGGALVQATARAKDDERPLRSLVVAYLGELPVAIVIDADHDVTVAIQR